MNGENENVRLYGVLKELENSGSDTARGFVSGKGASAVSGVRRKCVIDEDWLVTVENALPDIGKAIEQSRSLIKDNGEVVRIDRAKKTNKDSLAHLAKHSNLIKHLPEDDRIIPDEIYVPENDEDYAVYENRFLYLLLTQLAAFISVRYEGIMRALSESGISLDIEREINASGRALRYSLSVAGSSFSDSAADLSTRRITDRIRRAGEIVQAYLASPVMARASSAPRLVPPVVRTNIIKNNVHFNAAFELYSYICSYSKTGYSSERETVNEKTVSDNALKKLASIADLQLFTAYSDAFSGWEDCDTEYAEYKDQKLRAGIARAQKELFDLKASCEKGKISEQEYILRLETASASFRELAEKAAYETERLRADCAAEKGRADSLLKENERVAELMRENAKKDELELGRRLNEAERAHKKREEELVSRFAEEKAKAEEERLLISSRLTALLASRGEAGETPDRDSFIELEREKAAFDRYYKDQWAKAKKRIRREEYAKRKKGK